MAVSFRFAIHLTFSVLLFGPVRFGSIQFRFGPRLNPKDVYDKLGEIFAGLSVFSLFFVLALTFKGVYFPSTDDSGSNGSFIQDYWW